jgi:2-oxoisovalerate dehydrogenase E1 component alpha subunit
VTDSAFGASAGAAPMAAPATLTHPVSDQPDLVQLLTPEGERVEHPDYAIDLSEAELQELYRDLVLVRRVDAEATAL